MQWCCRADVAESSGGPGKAALEKGPDPVAPPLRQHRRVRHLAAIHFVFHSLFHNDNNEFNVRIAFEIIIGNVADKCKLACLWVYAMSVTECHWIRTSSRLNL